MVAKNKKDNPKKNSKLRTAFKVAAVGAVGYAVLMQGLPSFNFGSEPAVDAAVAERLGQAQENSITFIECHDAENGRNLGTGVARGEVIARETSSTTGSVTYTDYNTGAPGYIRLEGEVDKFACRFQAGEFRTEGSSRYLVPSDRTEFLITSRGGETLAADTARNNGLELSGNGSSDKISWRREVDGSRESTTQIATMRIVTRVPGGPT